jgi:archaellum component FlaF (FlaF/FlaG flagellin family)
MDMPDESRTVSFDVPAVSDTQTITVAANGDTFSGEVTRIDTYSETTTVERVINYTITFKHHMEGDEWVPWKAYLIEEPAGIYRLNVVESDGSRSRTHNFDTLTDVTVEHTVESSA